MSKVIPIPGKDEELITNQDLFEMHQAFNMILTSKNPMWKAVAFLEKKKIAKFYKATCASDNIPNHAKIDSMIRKLNNLQHEYLEHGEDGQPVVDTTKDPVNGQPVYMLKPGKNIDEFNAETSQILAKTVIIKNI